MQTLRDETFTYDLTQHRHRFAAWCAASAARSSRNCRFTVAKGHELLNRCEVMEATQTWDNLPDPEGFDDWHHSWCERLIAAAPGIIGSGKGRKFRYGVAAKLLNCYLKPLFVVGVDDGISAKNLAKRDAIHPPIDRVLLSALARSEDTAVAKHRDTWRGYMAMGWSSFDARDYKAVISAIREVTGGALWTIEAYWPGYQ